ncbi:hypothetical protein D3C83_227280 [compost metagenome]
MSFAKTPCIQRAERGMVTATAFGDIVKQGTEVEQMWRIKSCKKLATKREFVCELRKCKTPKVT